ncbi:MAG: right-handed parallel beta-helix repeat-containing protein [Candidatus Sumerlaeia bacterium]|nr:right-handed parallel beta-helix repeat-containing protein [Candidatus Sumerlaeia bacterium]
MNFAKHGLSKAGVLLLSSILFFSQGTLNAEEPTLSYQGRLLRNSNLYNGSAEFLFALVVENQDEEEIVWSNDPNASFAPTVTGTPVQLNVNNGNFTSLIGDAIIPNMSEIEPSVWNQEGKYFLRVWVRTNSGDAFEQLQPDQRITNPRSYGQEASRNQVIYVNPVTGNDRFSGIRQNRPKKTLESALSTVPASIRKNVTIQLADGVYYESLTIANYMISGPDAGLSIIGNTVNPSAVVFSGASETSPTIITETLALRVTDLGGTLRVSGITFDDYVGRSVYVDKNGKVVFENCQFSNDQSNSIGLQVYGFAVVNDSKFTGRNGLQVAYGGTVFANNLEFLNLSQFYGVQLTNGGHIKLSNSTFSGCSLTAIEVLGGDLYLSDCVINNNGTSNSYAVSVHLGGRLLATGTDFTNNTFGALKAANNSSVLFRNPANTFTGNGTALRVDTGATVIAPTGVITFASNTQNTSVASNAIYSTSPE